MSLNNHYNNSKINKKIRTNFNAPNRKKKRIKIECNNLKRRKSVRIRFHINIFGITSLIFLLFNPYKTGWNIFLLILVLLNSIEIYEEEEK